MYISGKQILCLNLQQQKNNLYFNQGFLCVVPGFYTHLKYRKSESAICSERKQVMDVYNEVLMLKFKARKTVLIANSRT